MCDTQAISAYRLDANCNNLFLSILDIFMDTFISFPNISYRCSQLQI